MRTEEEKITHIEGRVEIREMGIEELKDDDRVVLRTDSEGFKGLEVGVDGGFIKRLEEVMRRYQSEVELAVVGGTIIAVVLASERLKKRKIKSILHTP